MSPNSPLLFALTLCGSLLLGGCATQPPETPAEMAARRELACQAAGFTPDSPDLRLGARLGFAQCRCDLVCHSRRFRHSPFLRGSPPLVKLDAFCDPPRKLPVVVRARRRQ